MANSVGLNTDGPIQIDITLNGRAMPDMVALISVKIQHGINQIPRAYAVISDAGPSQQGFENASSDLFVPGTSIEIRAGYGAEDTAPLFTGEITGIGIKASATGATMSLTCHDRIASMNTARATTTFQDMKDSDAITSLFARSGLRATVEPTTEKRAYAVMSDETPWDYVRRRADFNGMLVTTRGGHTTVAPPAFATPVWVATYGNDILDLDIELDGAAQPPTVGAQAWAPEKQSTITATAAEPTVNKQGNLTGLSLSAALSVSGVQLTTQAPLDPTALQARADAALLRSRLSRIRGTVRIPGLSGVWPGDLLALKGLGPRFDGDGFVSGVEHVIEAGIWNSKVTLGLTADVFPTAKPHEPNAPTVSGLQIAKVIQISEDPENEYRVQVKFPQHTDADAGVWVRLASPYASDGAGFEFLPEIDDEIVVGFLGGNADAPVMLGALHSSARPAPITPGRGNNMKTIVSREQLKMSFDDDNKALHIETPGGHVVTLSDNDKSVKITDSNWNKLSMTEAGIDLSSPKDVNITAEGQLSLNGQSGIAIASASNVAISGANTSVEADEEVRVSGKMSAALTSDGQTTVEGTMVKIN